MAPAVRSDAARNRQALIEAASRLFMAAGADGEPSLRLIAREAGVGIGTLFRHFPTREALVEAVYQDQVRRLTEGAEQLLAEHPPAQAMRRWMDLFADWMANKNGMHETLRAMVGSQRLDSGETRTLLLAAIETILRAGRATGEISAHATAEDVAAGPIGISTVAPITTSHELASRLLDIFMNGLPVVRERLTERNGARSVCASVARTQRVEERARMQEPQARMSTGTSRAVQLESFGGPEALVVIDVPEPQARPGQIRVRVTAAGLNPMDWFMTSDAETAARFGLSLPCGFGTDYAGVVDQVGDGVAGFAVGDRVFGGAVSRAVADHVVVDVPASIATGSDVHHTPDGLDDRHAATVYIAGCTAAAALAVVEPRAGDTVLVGGAGGGVGVFAVQLAVQAGARVIGTGSASSAEALRALGAEPVVYGDGLVERVRALAPGGVTAAMDLYGTETVQAARDLGVPDTRITAIAAQVDGVRSANGAQAAPGAIEEIAGRVADGRVRVPLAATFPVKEIRAAVELQAGRHVHGKVVIDL